MRSALPSDDRFETESASLRKQHYYTFPCWKTSPAKAEKEKSASKRQLICWGKSLFHTSANDPKSQLKIPKLTKSQNSQNCYQ